MTSNFQQSPYLRVQRKFPTDDIRMLSGQVDQAYVDIAGKVNSRTIGIFAINDPIVTGEKWYFQGNSQKQQTLRQVYPITSFASFNHGINFAEVSTFTVIRGIAFDGTVYYPIPHVNPNNPNSNVGIVVNSTQVIFNTLAPPGIISGFVLLEWLSQF